jgi:hypothetical protein
MKRFSKIVVAAALTCVIGIADAACPPYAYRECNDARLRCVANGTNPDICEVRFELCMARKGCGPIP